jgi:hypothetical protein
VWPWLAQMGQGRGGLYSYDVLENLIGCDIHSADHIVEEWQHVTIGDPFRLHPDIALRVVVVERDHALVVRGGVPMGAIAPPYDCTWAFVLTENADGNTRLIIRERYCFKRSWASLLVEPVAAVSFVMTRKMLHSIRARAERQQRVELNPLMASRSDPSPGDVSAAGVYLYWLPLGAGAHVVRLSGRVFEAIAARVHHRATRDLYHSALEVATPQGSFVIEMTPIAGDDGEDRGVVAEGAVGTKWARPLRVFRYEIHRWRNGVIPDVCRAVESPVQVSADPTVARRMLELASSIPTPVWGRDELRAGEMWNSNSVTAWLLSRSGIDVDRIQLPRNGRAPGWAAGLAVAGRVDADADATNEPPAAPDDSERCRPSTAVEALGGHVVNGWSPGCDATDRVDVREPDGAVGPLREPLRIGQLRIVELGHFQGSGDPADRDAPV